MPVKISVVIPVYNVEAYLEECLDSLLNQTLKEIEIICVDDGSSDNSLSIMNTFAKKDKRVQSLSQKNQGVCVARNRGLEKVLGEYVYFMDSDDYLESDYSLETMYETASADKLDVLSFNYRTVGYEQKNYSLSIQKDVVMNGKQALLENGSGYVMPWVRFLRRAYLQEIDFSYIPNIAAEDDEALPRLYYDAKRVKHIDKILIVYRQRDDSITKSAISMTRIHGLSACVKTYFDLSRRESDPSFSRFLYHLGLEYLFILYESLLSVKDTKSAQKQYRDMLEVCSFTPIEQYLIKNEEIFIDYHKIEGKEKRYKLSVYYIRRLRILYFKYIRKYGHR